MPDTFLDELVIAPEGVLIDGDAMFEIIEPDEFLVEAAAPDVEMFVMMSARTLTLC